MTKFRKGTAERGKKTRDLKQGNRGEFEWKKKKDDNNRGGISSRNKGKRSLLYEGELTEMKQKLG